MNERIIGYRDNRLNMVGLVYPEQPRQGRSVFLPFRDIGMVGPTLHLFDEGPDPKLAVASYFQPVNRVDVRNIAIDNNALGYEVNVACNSNMQYSLQLFKRIQYPTLLVKYGLTTFNNGQVVPTQHVDSVPLAMNIPGVTTETGNGFGRLMEDGKETMVVVKSGSGDWEIFDGNGNSCFYNFNTILEQTLKLTSLMRKKHLGVREYDAMLALSSSLSDTLHTGSPQ